jgi:acyl dehydratase
MQVTKTRGVAMANPDESDRGRRYYLEDLHVGQRFTSATHEIDAAQIKAYAREFDPQPFHLDDEAAKATLFGGLAASGWHTAAISMRLMVESGLPLAGGILGAGGEINWPKPTRPGDILQVVSEIEEITPSRSRPDRGMVRVRNETRNQRGEILQVLIAKLIVPRRTAANVPGAVAAK